MNVRNLLPALIIITLALGACGGKEDRAASYLERAQTAFDQGDLIKAQLEAKNALQILPNNFQASYLLAQVAEEENSPQQMITYLRRSVEIDPTNVEAQVKMGRIWAAGNQIDRARDSVAAIEASDPGNNEGRVLQAIILLRTNEVQEGRDIALDVLRQEPRNISALAFLASSYQRDDVDKSLEYLEQAIDYEPENQSLRVVKVTILQKEGRLAEAESELRDLIGRFPEENAYRYALARYMVSQSRGEDALNVLRDLVSSDPDDLTAKLTLAQFMGNQGQTQDAIDLLNKYIQDEPEVYQFRFGLAQTYVAREEFDQAKAVFRDIMERDGKGVHGLTARTKLAALEFSRGDDAVARGLITEVLEEEPGNPDALIMRSSVALGDGRWDDATGDLRNVLRADPTRENAQLLLAKAHMMGNQTELAIETYQKLISAYPKNLNGRKDLASLLVRENRWDEVRELLAVGVQQRPEDLAIARLYVDSLLRAQDWDNAEAQAQRILDLDPTKALGHYVMGRVEQERGALAESINTFQVALDINPNAAETLTAMVRSYVRLDDSAGALAYLESFSQNAPENAHALSLLGEMQARTGDWAAAEASNLKALDTTESWLPAYRNLIGIYLRGNEMDKADAIVRRGLKVAPKNNELLLLQANVLEQTGRFLDAINNYESILESNPSIAVAANNYIALVADHRNDPASLAKANQYAQNFNSTDNPIFKDSVGWLKYRMGDYAGARELLEDAVGRAGKLPQLRYHLGMTYYRLDQLDAARTELEAALAVENPQFNGVEEARETLARIQ